MACSECAALRARAERAERDVERLTERVHKADGMAQEVNLLTGEVRQVTARAERAEEALRAIDALAVNVEKREREMRTLYEMCRGGDECSRATAREARVRSKDARDFARNLRHALAAPRTVAAQLAAPDADATVPPDRELLKPTPSPSLSTDTDRGPR